MIKEQLAQENLLPHLDYLSSLHAREQIKWTRDEAFLALEENKVRIKALVGQFQETFKQNFN